MKAVAHQMREVLLDWVYRLSLWSLLWCGLLIVSAQLSFSLQMTMGGVNTYCVLRGLLYSQCLKYY